MSAPVAGAVIAGTSSGTGKTSLSVGIMGALLGRGYEVVPFKVGPDYIDPGYHVAVAGRPSRNLDTWMTSPEEAQSVFQRAVAGVGGAGSPVAVVEGVMGLFDGLGGDSDRCSTAEMAKLLGLPVVLVVDCSSLARSAAALVHGYSTFDPELTVAGVILNKVGSPGHARALREALAGGPPILGTVPRRADLHLSSRHLGLVLAEEHGGHGDVLEQIAEHVAEHVDLDGFLDCAAAGAERGAPATGTAASFASPSSGPPFPGSNARRAPTIAVARDAAFAFYYQDNLDVLAEEGAKVVFFSPLEGEGLPACDAVYLGGGYPEVHARRLASNDVLRRGLKSAAADGLRVYAECGGYLYLGRTIEYDGAVHSMAGVLPTDTEMTAKRLRLGYVEAVASPEHPLAGRGFRGHLFHYSYTGGSSRPAYDVRRRDDRFEDGWSSRNIIASYVHLHFRGSRAIARWLVHGEEGSD